MTRTQWVLGARPPGGVPVPSPRRMDVGGVSRGAQRKGCVRMAGGEELERPGGWTIPWGNGGTGRGRMSRSVEDTCPRRGRQRWLKDVAKFSFKMRTYVLAG